MPNETKTCACGEITDSEKPWPYPHGTNYCAIEGKSTARAEFERPARELVAARLKVEQALKQEQELHEQTRTHLRRTEEERAAEWRRAERWQAAAEACARIVAGDDSVPHDSRPGGPMAMTDLAFRGGV